MRALNSLGIWLAAAVVVVSVAGCKGDPGAQGPQGPEGTQGPAGPAGPAYGGITSILAFADPGTITADDASVTLKIQLVSASGDAVTGQTVTVTTTGGSAAAVEELEGGNYSAKIDGLVKAGTYFAQVTSGALTSALVPIVVNPGAPAVATSSLTVANSKVIADGASEAWVRFVPIDAAGNLLGADHEVSFETTSGTASFGAVVNEHNGTWSVPVTATTAGPVSLHPLVDGQVVDLDASIDFVAPPEDVTTVAAYASPSHVMVGPNGAQVIISVNVNGKAASTRSVSVAVGTGSAVAGQVTELGNGLYVANVTDLVAETAVILVTDDQSSASSPVEITFTPAAARTLSVSFAAPQITADVGTTDAQILLQDEYGNGVPGELVSAMVMADPANCATDSVDGSTVCPSLSAVTEVGNGVYSATLSGVHVAGVPVRVMGIDGMLVANNDLAVVPGAVDAAASVVTLQRAQVPADGMSPAIVSITPRDRYDNAVGTGLTVSGAPAGTTSAVVSTFSDVGDGSYIAWLTDNTIESADFDFTADGVTLTPPAQVSFVASTLSMSIQANPDPVAVNAVTTLTVQVQDGLGAPVANAQVAFYVGATAMPINGCTTNAAGTCQLPFSIATAGTWSILAQEVASGTAIPTTLTVQ